MSNIQIICCSASHLDVQLNFLFSQDRVSSDVRSQMEVEHEQENVENLQEADKETEV